MSSQVLFSRFDRQHGPRQIAEATAADRFDLPAFLGASGLGWTVTKKQLAVAPGDDLAGTIADDVFGVFRTDNWQCLAACGRTYRPLQNPTIFEQFRPFVDCGAMAFERAGSFDGGRKVFVQARLTDDDADLGGGDRIAPTLLLASSHDGSLATTGFFTPKRLFCDNQLPALQRAGALFKIRHTAGQLDSLAAAQRIVATAREQFDGTIAAYKKLMARRISHRELAEYARAVLQIDDGAKPSPRIANQFDRVLRLALYGRGQSAGELTAWSALNGVTEWTTHYRQRTAAEREKSVWFGSSAGTNSRALELALQLAT